MPSSPGLKVLDVRQLDGEIRLGHGHRAALVAVDDRDRRTPVALARDAPVVQADSSRRRCRGRAPTASRRSARFASSTGRPVNSPEFTRRAPSVSVYGDLERRVRVDDLRTGDDPDDRQIERRRELEVALVVAGNGHDRAGSVLHQHVVGDPDRDGLLRRGIDGERAGEDARLLLVHLARDDVLLRRARLVLRDLRRAARRVVSASTSGCSGASTRYVAPNSVSGRVVKTRMSIDAGGELSRRDRRSLPCR